MAVCIRFDHGHYLARASQLPNPLEIAAQFGEGNFNPRRAQKFISRNIHRIYLIQMGQPFNSAPGGDFKSEI
jgi:hypothetical protein